MGLGHAQSCSILDADAAGRQAERAAGPRLGGMLRTGRRDVAESTSHSRARTPRQVAHVGRACRQPGMQCTRINTCESHAVLAPRRPPRTRLTRPGLPCEPTWLWPTRAAGTRVRARITRSTETVTTRKRPKAHPAGHSSALLRQMRATQHGSASRGRRAAVGPRQVQRPGDSVHATIPTHGQGSEQADLAQ